MTIFEGDANKATKKRLVASFLSKTKSGLLDGSLRLNDVGNLSDEEMVYANNQEFKYIGGHFQVHHIIPRELFQKKTSPTYKLLNAIGFTNENFLQNLVALPTAPYLPRAVAEKMTPMHGRGTIGRTPHNGSYPMYTEYIEEELAVICGDNSLAIGCGAWQTTAAAAKCAVMSLISSVGDKLRSGTLRLQ
ncbi:MAG: AHH domain-containing protein [Puniceicoccales bacterium]|nr:AHH domain-containing protein [Puniceicoccales bacterium]